MKESRNYTLDVLRGFLLIIMTVDHFSNQVISYNFGYCSAAEGFVFLSGLVMGLYGVKKYNSEGYTKLISNLTTRAFRIYKYHFFTFLFLFILTGLLALGQNSISAVLSNSYKDFFWETLLIFKPKGLDILPMYIFFVLISPFILNLLFKKKIGLVFSISIFLWSINYILIDSRLVYWFSKFNIPLSGEFSILSWQLIYVTGLIIGFLITSDLLKKILARKIVLEISILVVVVFFLQKYFMADINNSNLMYRLTSRNTLGPIRIINFFAFSYLLFYLFSRITIPKSFNSIALLGKYSIQVFTFHLVLLILFREFVPTYTIEIFSAPNNFQLILNNLFIWLVTLPVSILLFIPVIILKFKPEKLPIQEKSKNITIINSPSISK